MIVPIYIGTIYFMFNRVLGQTELITPFGNC